MYHTVFKHYVVLFHGNTAEGVPFIVVHLAVIHAYTLPLRRGTRHVETRYMVCNHSLNLIHIVQVDTGKRIVAWNPCSEGL